MNFVVNCITAHSKQTWYVKLTKDKTTKHQIRAIMTYVLHPSPESFCALELRPTVCRDRNKMYIYKTNAQLVKGYDQPLHGKILCI